MEKNADGDALPPSGEETRGEDPLLGIVIPTCNEAKHLPLLLSDLDRSSLTQRVVVADGGSEDGTPELARQGGATVVHAPRGRASQMNQGAGHLDSPWLLFLHADARLPESSLQALQRWLWAADSQDVGTFKFALQGRHWFWRFLEWGQRLRERMAGLVYGDQGLVVSADLFRAAGGFPDLPVMEDVELFCRLRRLGRWRKIPAPLLSSPRRYEKEGRWRGWIRNSFLITLYLVGVQPRQLARFYPSAGALRPGTDAGRTLLVFAKEPTPGKVKTRLAREVGGEAAANIYRLLGRAVVDQVREGGYRTVVCFDPPGSLGRIEDWLDPQGLEFRAQGEGDLGDRLAVAFREAFTVASRVIAIGTDAPGVDAKVVEEAFRRLDEADLVLGPARDGGYYLVGLQRHRTELFLGIPWSTERVLEVTKAKAQALGLKTALLPVRSDVDTLNDWKVLRRGPSGGG